MALTTTDIRFDTTKDDRPDLPPTPAVATTPCDPWPRPYYLENGLRRVAPYHYTYNTYCKARWRDREILDIFAVEFRDRTKEYYEKAIKDGSIVLNGKECKDVHTVVKNGDVISHTIHRHEPPVSAQPIRVVHEDDEMIVIDKPAGVPVHPAGRYNYNSVVEIMRAERNYAFNPLPCNRLDRLTSGVMFVGKTGKEAEKISAKLRERTVRKEYAARVKGRFPDGEGWNGDEMRGGIVKCEEPILQISPILGLNRARASGKSAKTLFRRVAYYPPKSPSGHSDAQRPSDGDSALAGSALPGTEDEGYSIVHCLPLTGRTHQIRVHLQFLGHPISNDPIYSNRRVFGPTLAKGDSSGDHDDEIKERLGRMGKTEIAGADTYSEDKSPPTKPHINGTNASLGAGAETEIDVKNFTADQTMQTTPSLLFAQQQHQQQQRQPPSVSATPSKLNHSLPRGTLHTGTLTHEPDLVAAHTEMVADYNKRKGEKLTGAFCSICQTPLYSDPGPQEMGIYLHALAYADVEGAWRYTSPMPEWTRDGEGRVMEAPRWDFEELGGECWVDVEEEKEEGVRRNRRGEERNKRQSGSVVDEGGG